MKLPFPAALPGLCFFAFLIGCGNGQDQYVDFSQTAPSEIDAKRGATEEVSGAVTDASVSSNGTPAKSSTLGSIVSEGTAPESVKEVPALPPSEEIASGNNEERATGSAASSSTPAAQPEIADVQPIRPDEAIEVEMVKNGDPAGEKTPERPMITSAQSGLLGPADMPVVENSAVSEPRKIELLIPELRLRKERGTEALRVTYDDVDLLKVLNMEPVPVDAVEFFPAWLKSLDGKLIRIRGFMYPTFQATGLIEFTLARDNGICCFVRQPKIYDIIGVTLAAGETTDYIEGRPFDVEGIFRIVPQADEKDLSRLYSIENAKVLH